MKRKYSMMLTITPGVDPVLRGKIGDVIRKVFKEEYGGSVVWNFGETGLGEGQLMESVEGWDWTTRGDFTVQDLLDLIPPLDPYRISLEVEEIKPNIIH